MSLDISKITDAILKAMAQRFDTDENGILSDFEIERAGGISVFEGINEDAFIQDSFQSTGITTPQKRREIVLDALTDYVDKNGLSADLMALLEKRFSNPDYANDLNSVREFLEKIKNEGYKTKDDIKKLEKKRNNLQEQVEKGNDIALKYQKVYDKIIEVAKNDIIAKEISEISDMYFNEVIYTGNHKKDIDALKQMLKDKGLWGTSYYKDAYNRYVKVLKRGVSYDVKVDMAKNYDDEKAVEIRRTAKENHTEEVGKDKVYNQSVRTKENKEFSEGIARHNKFVHRAKDLQSVTKDVLEEALGKDLLYKLDTSFLSGHVNANGTYDVSALAGALLRTVGYDIMMNRSEENEINSEMFHAKYAISKLLKLESNEISDDEVLKIMDLCAVPMEDKEKIFLKWADAIENLLTGATAGGLGAVGASPVINITQNVELTIQTDLARDAMTQLDLQRIKYTTATASNGDITIKILQEVFDDRRVFDVLEGIAKGLGVALIAHIAMNAIFGEGQAVEKSCISLTDQGRKCKSLKEYSEFVKEKYPDKADGLILMAKLFTYEGTDNLDAEKLYEYFDLVAGEGSNLNCIEGMIAMFRAPKPEMYKASKTEIEPTQGAATAGNTEAEAEVTKKIPKVEKNNEKSYDKTHTHVREYGDTWGGILKAYYPGLNIQDIKNDPKLFGPDGLIRKFKRALAYDENGVFHPEVFKRLLEDKNLPENIKIPSEFEGVERITDNEVEKVKQTAPKDGEKYNGKALKTVGHDEKGTNIEKVYVDGEPIYKATDISGEHNNEYEFGKTKEEAIKNLENKTGEKYENINDKTGDKTDKTDEE